MADFAYRRKVFCVCPHDLLRIRERLREGFGVPAQRRFAPSKPMQYSPFAYFRTVVCSLYPANNVIFGSLQRHLPVEGESLCDCSDVTFGGQSDIGTPRR